MWFDVVKGYNYEILYHPSKAKEVVDALICRVNSAPIRDVCLRTTIVTPIMEMIRGAHVDAMKENYIVRVSELLVMFKLLISTFVVC